MALSRRTYFPDPNRKFTHYRICPKYKIVEGLLVFAFDSFAIYDRQEFTSFFFLINSYRPAPLLSAMSYQDLCSISIKDIDQYIPLLSQYFEELAQWFLNGYSLSLMDQTSSNLFNILGHFSYCFGVEINVYIEENNRTFPDSSIDEDKALTICIMADHVYFYYPSITSRDPPGLMCRNCKGKVREETGYCCQKLCLICEGCWRTSINKNDKRCPSCKEELEERILKEIENKFNIKPGVNICHSCQKMKNPEEIVSFDDLIICKGCVEYNSSKHNAISKQNSTPKQLPQSQQIIQSDKIAQYHQLPHTDHILQPHQLSQPHQFPKPDQLPNPNQFPEPKQLPHPNPREEGKKIGYCCEHVDKIYHNSCKCLECARKQMNKFSDNGQTYCYDCRTVYSIDFLESMYPDYKKKLQCDYCKKERFYRFVYKIGMPDNTYICLDCIRIRDFNFMRNQINISHKADRRKMDKRCYVDCCNRETDDSVSLCTALPSHLNHRHHKICQVCRCPLRN